MSTASAAAAGNANFGTGNVAGRKRQTCRSGLPDMQNVQGKKPQKLANFFAAVTGKHIRTTERWVAGETTPDGDSTLKIYLRGGELGARLLEAKVAEMTRKEQEQFWREMGKAQKRADLRQRQEALAREIAELEAEQTRR